MRIVGGKLKGRVLAKFDGLDVRPTSDMARESLFNILQFQIQGKSFLDLFCGTGAVGIEALSRGAKNVTLNDGSRKSLDIVNKNLTAFNIKNEVTVTNKDAITFLTTTSEKYDFVYIDPPYKSGLGRQAVINSKDVLTDGGIIILEDDKEFDGVIEGLEIADKRKYGKVHLTFFAREN